MLGREKGVYGEQHPLGTSRFLRDKKRNPEDLYILQGFLLSHFTFQLFSDCQSLAASFVMPLLLLLRIVSLPHLVSKPWKMIALRWVDSLLG